MKLTPEEKNSTVVSHNGEMMEICVDCGEELVACECHKRCGDCGGWDVGACFTCKMD